MIPPSAGSKSLGEDKRRRNESERHPGTKPMNENTDSDAGRMSYHHETFWEWINAIRWWQQTLPLPRNLPYLLDDESPSALLLHLADDKGSVDL